MTNKLAKQPGVIAYGEDTNALLKRERENGIEVADLEKRVLVQYLNNIRHEFEVNGEIRNILVNAKPATTAREAILEHLDWLKHPDTPDLFEKAVTMLLNELENMRKEEPSAYLIDRSTGMAVKALEEGDIFQPPDYYDENGNKKQALKKVHPKITASLTMEQVGLKRKEELQQRLDDPKYKLALAHIKDPEGIIKRTRALLESRGVSFMKMEEGESEEIVFGKEHVHGDEQSINPAFHRLSNYSSILATKIMKMVSPGDFCWIDDLSEKKSAKHKWYTVRVWTKSVNQLN